MSDSAKRSCETCHFAVKFTPAGSLTPQLLCYHHPPQVLMIPQSRPATKAEQLQGANPMVTTFVPTVARPPCEAVKWCFDWQGLSVGEVQIEESANPH